jgi:signal peptidase
MRVAGKTLRVALALAGWALTGAAIAIIAAALAPQAFGWKSLTILTGSMEPTIGTGDVVVDEQIRASELRPGDIVTFREPGRKRLITHRVRRVVKDGAQLDVTTKGDANKTAEHWSIPASGAVGRVSYRLPYLGYALQWTSAPHGKLLLIALPAAVLGVWELVRIWRPRRREEACDATEV